MLPVGGTSSCMIASPEHKLWHLWCEINEGSVECSHGSGDSRDIAIPLTYCDILGASTYSRGP